MMPKRFAANCSFGHLVSIASTLLFASLLLHAMGCFQNANALSDTTTQEPNANAQKAATGQAAKAQQPEKIRNDWPVPRGDAGSSGATDTKLPMNLDVLWEFKADEAIEATPTVVGDKVFASDVFGKLYAINRADGKEVWQKNYDTGFLASPAIQNDIIVIGDVEGNLYGIDPDDGTELWKQQAGGEISGSAAFYKTNVLVTSQDGKLYCFDAKTGKPQWAYETDDQVQCSATVAGDRSFLGGCDGKLHIVDLTTGKAACEPLPLGGPTGSTPAIQGNDVFLPIMAGTIYRFDSKNQKQEWEYVDPDRDHEYRNSASVKGDVVVVSSQFKQVDAISIATGKRLWKHTLRRRADASPLISADDVWIAASDGRLIRLNLKDGKERWKYEIKGSFLASPAIAGEQLFVADDDGVVRCFGEKKL